MKSRPVKILLWSILAAAVISAALVWLAARQPPGPGDTAWRALVREKRWSKYADLGGYRLHYHEAGRGRPVLLIHGYGDSSYTWRHNIGPLVQAGFRVIAPDLPGLGASGIPPGYTFSAEAFADQITALLEHKGLDRVHVVGNSLGGNLALYLAVRRPSRVDRIVPVDPAAYPDPRHGTYESLARRPITAKLLKPFFCVPAVRFALKKCYHDPDLVSEAMVSERAQVLRRPDFPENMVRIGANYFSSSFKELLPGYKNIKAPVLIVWGDTDRLLKAETYAERLHRDIPGSSLVIIKEAGHTPHEEQPRAFNKALASFLKSKRD